MKRPAILANASASTPAEACPCGSGRTLVACCGRWHAGELADTPEALMRSRYAAFVLDVRPYLLATWHPDHRPAEIEPPEPGLKWLGLSVQHSAVHPLGVGEAVPHWAQGLSGGPLQAWGEVAFVARYKIGGRAHRLVEHSVFARQGDAWRYVAASPDGAGRAAAD